MSGFYWSRKHEIAGFLYVTRVCANIAKMARIRDVASLSIAVSEVVEEEISCECNDDELEGLALLFLETGRIVLPLV